MKIRTHQDINLSLCGRPERVEGGCSDVILTTTDNMAVDASGLVHGGFVFGLADHAAMIAVNHPNVVLGAADVRFLKPVRVGETLVAHARLKTAADKKKRVVVHVDKDELTVFEGTFTCFVLDKHVLDHENR